MKRSPFSSRRYAPSPRTASLIEEAGRAGDVEHGRVELHELHVAQLGPGAVGGGHAVAGGDRRVGRLAVDHARSRRTARIVCLAQTSSVPAPGRQTTAPTHAPVVGQQVEGEGVVPEGDVRRRCGPWR